jgi:hypothetical protein
MAFGDLMAPLHFIAKMGIKKQLQIMLIHQRKTAASMALKWRNTV